MRESKRELLGRADARAGKWLTLLSEHWFGRGLQNSEMCLLLNVGKLTRNRYRSTVTLTAFDTGDGPLVGTNSPGAGTDYFTCPLSWEPHFANILIPKLAHLSTYWLFEGRLGWKSSWQQGSCKDGGAEGREDEVAGGDRAQLQALGPSGGSDPFWSAPAKSFNLPNDTGRLKELPTLYRNRGWCSRWVAGVAFWLKVHAPLTAWLSLCSAPWERKSKPLHAGDLSQPLTTGRPTELLCRHILPLTSFLTNQATKEAPMDRGARRVIVHGVTKSQTR